MELEFIKKANRYVAEFEATADFNLHIEGVPEGDVILYQKGVPSGDYVKVNDGTPSPSVNSSYDYDCQAVVYPKYIKVSCAMAPTYAAVTTAGEVTELKYQEKTVDVAENGTSVVTADAGFMGLSKVSVNVNVPQSGGGEGSATEYFRIDWDRLKSEFGYLPAKDYENIDAFLAKQASIFVCVTSAHFGVSTMMGVSQITPVAALLIAAIQMPGFVDISDIKKIALTTFTGYNGGDGSFVEMTPDYLLSGKYRDCFISITEEEFYAGF